MDYQELFKLIQTRRSIRKFRTNRPEDLLLKALELATWAPNGGNYQPWRFLVITNKSIIHKMADEVKSKTTLMGAWPEAQKFGETVQRWQKNSDFFRGAPVCIAVLMGKYLSMADQILKIREEKDLLAQEMRSSRQLGNSTLQSVAAAISYLSIALHLFGLGSTWVAGIQVAKKEIERLLNVDPEWDLVDLIPLGYPAESPTPPPRKPVSEVVQFLR
jgi:nitroreductase